MTDDGYDSEGCYYDRETDWLYGIESEIYAQMMETKPWYYRVLAWLQRF